jgi:hypothetical protein
MQGYLSEVRQLRPVKGATTSSVWGRILPKPG